MTDNAAAGAMPAVPDATSGQTAAGGATTGTAQPTTQPATGAPDDTLGEAGTKAIKAERDARKAAEDRAKAAEQELETLRAAGQSEQEKALAAARKDVEKTTTEKWQGQIRRSEVRAALAAAGVQAGLLDLAVKADEFNQLVVGEDGTVAGLEDAVGAFKKARPLLFGAAATNGSGDTGTGGGGRTSGRTFKRSELRDPAFFAKNRPEIMAAMTEGRIVDG